jgi:xylose dehydrogenase (NAD/NADP)
MVEKIRFGILGFGIFGKKRLIPGFKGSELGMIEAITKTKRDEAENEAKQFGIPKAFAYSEKDIMLKDPNIDAIYIAGPNYLHKKDAIDALEAGKHVILEKPMAMNVEECEEILEAVNRTKLKLMIANCLRFNDTVIYFKKYVQSGKLGRLLYGSADYCFNASQSPRKWVYNKEIAGGGPSFDLGVHTVDTLRYISDLNVKETTAWAYPVDRKENEVEHTAIFNLKFENEFYGRSIVSFIPEYTTFLEFVGTQGTIRATKWTLIESEVTVNISEGDKTRSVVIKNENQYSKEIDAFCKCIIDDTESPIPGEEGLINQSIIQEILRTK